MRKINFLALLCLLLLCSCTTLVPQNAEVWTGRFSVASKSGTSVDRHSGSFRLIVLPEKKVLNINGPFGAKIASIEETPNECVLINSDNETYKDPNSAVLVNQIIGIPLSLDRFLAWVKNEKNTGDLNSHDWKVRSEDKEGVLRIRAEGYVPSTDSQVTLTILPRKQP